MYSKDRTHFFTKKFITCFLCTSQVIMIGWTNNWLKIIIIFYTLLKSEIDVKTTDSIKNLWEFSYTALVKKIPKKDLRYFFVLINMIIILIEQFKLKLTKSVSNNFGNLSMKQSKIFTNAFHTILILITFKNYLKTVFFIFLCTYLF